MPLFYIAGAPGAGKSSLVKELKNRGLNALDADALCVWKDRLTRSITNKPAGVPGRTLSWLRCHYWCLPTETLNTINEEYPDSAVFICGNADNLDEVWDYFDEIFYLEIDERKMEERLTSRENSNFGKSSGELQIAIEQLNRYTRLMKNINKLDGSLPTKQIATTLCESVLTQRGLE